MIDINYMDGEDEVFQVPDFDCSKGNEFIIMNTNENERTFIPMANIRKIVFHAVPESKSKEGVGFHPNAPEPVQESVVNTEDNPEEVTVDLDTYE